MIDLCYLGISLLHNLTNKYSGIEKLTRAEHKRISRKNTRLTRIESRRFDVSFSKSQRFYRAATRLDARAGKEDKKYK